QRELEDIVAAYRAHKEVERQIVDAQGLLDDGGDPELRELIQAELEELRPRRDALDERVRLLLLPRDPNDSKNVIFEIRQGEGGDEAALFAADLYRMYTRYAERQGCNVEIINSNENGPGGFKEIVFEVQGDRTYGRLKYEGG